LIRFGRTLNDGVKLIPKSWFGKEHIAHVNGISCVYLEELDTVCCKSVSNVSIPTFRVRKFYKTMTTPDEIEWMAVCDSEMGTLERMKCWEVVDESMLPPDVELMILSGFLENG
jgi:hypothetical protein